jgi:CubicO group peptidase (beta-lactamase class C family)
MYNACLKFDPAQEACMKHFSLRCSLLVLLALSTVFVGAAPADERTDKVDKLFSAWDTTTSPGAVLAVIQDGRIVYERGYGMANLEDGTVMTPDKVFDIGSVSKQFTAACLAFLVRDGKVATSDDIRTYIPELPRYERTITLDHLLHHTSGLRDYCDLLPLAGFRSEADCPTMEETMDIICRQKKLNFLPGEEYDYSNTGYFLLGVVIERVSGRSLDQFAQEHIFKPLGMDHTFFRTDHARIIPGRAIAYSRLDSGYRLDMSNWEQAGDGSLQTTLRDLSLWDRAFYSDALGAGIIARIQTEGVLNSGAPMGYAWGLRVGAYKGLKQVAHSGSWAGYRAAMIRFPEQKFSVICLSNLSDLSPSRMGYRVAEIYLGPVLKEPSKAAAPRAPAMSLAIQELEALAGNYLDETSHQWLTLASKNGQLVMREAGGDIPFLAESPARFRTPEGPLDITLDVIAPEGLNPKRLKLTYGPEEIIEFVQAPPLMPLTGTDLAEFAGSYTSPELLDATYRLVVEKENLIVKFRSMPPLPLQAMAPDRFTLEGVNLDFIRNKSGKITGATMSTGRAAGIVFTKIK